MRDMDDARIEPGLLTIFRWYAGLRLGLFALFILLQSLRTIYSGPLEFRLPSLVYIVAVFIEMACLVGYLNWPWLRNRLGRAFLPLGILWAGVGLILEQNFIPSPVARFWSLDPFSFILLILVAWQYDFRAVLLFTFGLLGLEIASNVLFPQSDILLIWLGPLLVRMITFGSMLTRTVSFLIIGLVITGLMRAQRRQRGDLAEANRKLVRYAATQEQLAVSRERNRLARELHDTLAHTLSALTVQLEAVSTVWESPPARAQAMLEGMLESTRSGLDETRRALKALRAAPLEDMGLALALRAFVEDFAARHVLSLDISLPEELDDLPPDVEQGFYRVAQEALENVARHAQAHQVKVALSQADGQLQLTVADDGQGFEADSAVSGYQFGLQGMREWAELMGAELQVDSVRDQGTTVRLCLEVKHGAGIDLR
jgi:signal transduction histidine kinase